MIILARLHEITSSRKTCAYVTAPVQHFHSLVQDGAHNHIPLRRWHRHRGSIPEPQVWMVVTKDRYYIFSLIQVTTARTWSSTKKTSSEWPQWNIWGWGFYSWTRGKLRLSSISGPPGWKNGPRRDIYFPLSYSVLQSQFVVTDSITLLFPRRWTIGYIRFFILASPTKSHCSWPNSNHHPIEGVGAVPWSNTTTSGG